jgi:hypothetical protein
MFEVLAWVISLFATGYGYRQPFNPVLEMGRVETPDTPVAPL